VLLSTHVLSEVQQSCSRLLIISRGRIVADGPVDHLIQQAEGVVQIAVEVLGSEVAASLARLPGVRGVAPARPVAEGRIAVRVTAEQGVDVRPAIFEMARTLGWTLYELHQETGSLEELFRQLTEPAQK
jgi:ABC-2 type transport system ATP-binding protein